MRQRHRAEEMVSFFFSPLLVIVIPSPLFFYISVLCQTAPFIRCGTEIKCYCPATLSDDNVLCCCQGEELGCLLLAHLFPPVRGPSEIFQSRPLFCEKTFNSGCFFNPAMPYHPKPTFTHFCLWGRGEAGEGLE